MLLFLISRSRMCLPLYAEQRWGCNSVEGGEHFGFLLPLRSRLLVVSQSSIWEGHGGCKSPWKARGLVAGSKATHQFFHVHMGKRACRLWRFGLLL